jgi:hypothetical protein
MSDLHQAQEAKVMVSQSAQATTAAESRYRIDKPNSKGRSSLVIGLDKSSMPALSTLAEMEWRGARFRSVVQPGDTALAESGLEVAADDVALLSPERKVSCLSDELANTDVVVMFAQSGASAGAAEAIGKACFGRNLMTAGFVLDETGDRELLERTLTQVRPFVISLVVGSDEESLGETLSAIRA